MQFAEETNNYSHQDLQNIGISGKTKGEISLNDDDDVIPINEWMQQLLASCVLMCWYAFSLRYWYSPSCPSDNRSIIISPSFTLNFPILPLHCIRFSCSLYIVTLHNARSVGFALLCPTNHPNETGTRPIPSYGKTVLTPSFVSCKHLCSKHVFGYE